MGARLPEMGEGEMPKEVIHDSRPLDGTEGQSSPLAVEVGWGRGTWVNLGSINLQIEEGTESRGWFIDLDRYRINQLIRVLRKARDQAFGRDE